MNWPLIAAGALAAIAFFLTSGMPLTSRVIGVVMAAGVAYGGVHMWLKHDVANAGKRTEQHLKERGKQSLQQNEELGLKRDKEPTTPAED